MHPVLQDLVGSLQAGRLWSRNYGQVINFLTYSSRKEPDAGLFADHNDSKPTIALGAGYSESLADLRNDARTLLEGSQGVIRLVILIKIEPLGPQDTSIQSGHLEKKYGYMILIETKVS
jgi:hypothetical protein